MYYQSRTFEKCVHDSKCKYFKTCHTFMYFCGLSKDCDSACESETDEETRKKLLRRTIENVDRFYQIVVILEKLKISLKVVEAKSPEFFAGLSLRLSNFSKEKNDHY